MLRRQPPDDKEEKKLRDKARQSSVVAHIVGMTENDEESIIPPGAKQIDPYSTGQFQGLAHTPKNLGGSSPSEPSTSAHPGEELIPPTAALVAPDVTPQVFEPIDPSRVPAPPAPATAPGTPSVSPASPSATGAMDTILGRQNPSTVPPAVAVESFMQAVNPLEIKSRVADKLVPASAGGSGMPLHQEGDGRTIFNVVRSLVG
jgi:hypothetical protein